MSTSPNDIAANRNDYNQIKPANQEITDLLENTILAEPPTDSEYAQFMARKKQIETVTNRASITPAPQPTGSIPLKNINNDNISIVSIKTTSNNMSNSNSGTNATLNTAPHPTVIAVRGQEDDIDSQDSKSITSQSSNTAVSDIRRQSTNTFNRGPDSDGDMVVHMDRTNDRPSSTVNKINTIVDPKPFM